MASTSHPRRRRIVVGVLCLALAGGAATVILARQPKTASTIVAPSIFKTASVSRGDLTTKETVDGSVALSSTLTVLHRIEGQTSSSSAPATSATTQQPASGATNPSGSSSLLATATEALVDDCSSTTVAATPPEPTTTVVPVQTTPIAATPDTTPTATPTTTSTTVAPTEPPTTVTTAAVEPCATTTTAPADVPSAGGGLPTGGARNGAPGSAPDGSAATAATTRVTQTVTSIIATNTAIHQGDVLYTVDGAPVVALDGALPAWRTLSTSSDDGADIAQLEADLVALGYDPDNKVTIDDQFDSASRTMVKSWQQGLGIEATGTVTLGSVVFLPASTTVSEVARNVGDTIGDGDTVLTLATPTQEVLIDVPTGDEAEVVPGLAVGIGSIQGTVSRLRSANRNGAVVVEAVITPTTPIDKATNGTSVKVTLTLQNEAGVLIAPAEALVSRLDGTYAVQLQTSDGTTKWLTVELLGVSGGDVAIRGTDVTEGTVLLLPA